MKTRTWLSVPVAAVLALGGAASAYGSEDASDLDDQTVFVPGDDDNDTGRDLVEPTDGSQLDEQTDGLLVVMQDAVTAETAQFGGQLS